MKEICFASYYPYPIESGKINIIKTYFADYYLQVIANNR